jgi:dTDP-4-amino-4,6-dideoxygalactose transaminase
MGRLLGYAPGDFPRAERAWEMLLRLPVFPAMRDRHIDMVCDALRGACA